MSNDNKQKPQQGTNGHMYRNLYETKLPPWYFWSFRRRVVHVIYRLGQLFAILVFFYYILYQIIKIK